MSNIVWVDVWEVNALGDLVGSNTLADFELPTDGIYKRHIPKAISFGNMRKPRWIVVEQRWVEMDMPKPTVEELLVEINKANNELVVTKDKLKATTDELKVAKDELVIAKTELDTAKGDLNKTKKELAESQLVLINTTTNLTEIEFLIHEKLGGTPV